MNLRYLQKGVTLVELMIGLTVGLFVVGGVLTVYVATVQSSGETLKLSRLNQEMTTLTNIMANDIRRAGFWGNSASDNIVDNPFMVEGETEMEVMDVSSNTSRSETANFTAGTASGDCITYSYDFDNDGSVDLDELFGFKLQDEAIWMRTSCDNGGSDDCASTTAANCELGDWQRITDESTIRITALTFNANNSFCINASVEDASATVTVENDCYENPPSAGSEDATAEIRLIDISLTGELIDDAVVNSTMNISVRARNDKVQIHN